MKICNCDRALLPASGGCPATRIIQRDAVRVWTWQHLRTYPNAELTPVELARVIHQQYAQEPHQSRSGFSGRLATVKRVLAELEEQGDVVRSDDGKRWRAALVDVLASWRHGVTAILHSCDERTEHCGIAVGQGDERGEHLSPVELRPAELVLQAEHHRVEAERLLRCEPPRERCPPVRGWGDVLTSCRRDG